MAFEDRAPAMKGIRGSVAALRDATPDANAARFAEEGAERGLAKERERERILSVNRNDNLEIDPLLCGKASSRF